MRSVFVISLFVFIAVCTGGLAISWYGQALAGKHTIEQFLNSVNAKQQYITYDAIETTGFPMDVNVSIINPHFKGRVDQLINDIRGDTPSPESPIKEWLQDTSLDGKLIIGINAFSDRYTVNTRGRWVGTTAINGQTYAISSQERGDTGCDLKLQRKSGIFDTLWNFESFNRDGKAMLEDFRMLDCNSAGEQSIDSINNDMLSSAGPWRLYVTNAPQQSANRIRFYFKASDFEISPMGDARLADYFQSLSPGYQFPFAFSNYGKQNIEIDFSYSGPKNLLAADKNPELDVALSKMDITNQMYSEHMSFHVTNVPSEGNRNTTLSFKNESTVNEAYGAMLEKNVRDAVQSLTTSKDSKFSAIQARVKNYSSDELNNVVRAAIPDFHALGKMVITFDSNFKVTEDFKNGDYNLNAFELSATPYGVIGTGNLKTVPSPPTFNLQLSCANCLHMIDDIAAYTIKVQKIVSVFDPEKSAVINVDPAQVDAVKRFLAALSAPPKDPENKSTLTYAINGAGVNGTINNKSAIEIVKMYNEYIVPTLKKPTNGAVH